MYNIFQRISLERAIGTAILFHYSYSPFDYAIKYYLGVEKDNPNLYYFGKYSLLGQKIATSCVLPLCDIGLLPCSLNLDFLSDPIILPVENTADNAISAFSKPELGQGLKGTGHLIKDLFLASGWMISDLYVDTYFSDYHLDSEIEECEQESFNAWFSEAIAFIDDEHDCFLWKFHSKQSYSFDNLASIFRDMVRFSHCHISYLPDGSVSVYILGQTEESYDDCIYDTCDFSSIPILSPLLALYYAGQLNPSFLLEDFTKRGGGNIDAS